MKMFRIIILLTFLSVSFHAQQIQITSGTHFSTCTNSSGDLVFSGDTSGFFLINNALTLKKGELYLYKISSKTAQVIFKKEIWFNYSGTLTLVSANTINNKITLFVQVNNAEKQVYLMKHELLVSNGLETTKAIEIDRFEPVFDSEIVMDFAIKFSPDNSKIAIIREEESSSKKNMVNLKVLNTENYTKICEQKLNSNSQDEVPPGDNYILDNSGTLFYRFFSQSNNQFGIEGIYSEYKLNKYLLLPKDSMSIVEPEIELINNKLICSGEMLLGKNKSKLFNPGVENGFFLLNINPHNLQIINKSYEFLKQRVQNKLTYNDRSPNYKLEGFKSFFPGNKIYKHFKTFWFNDCIYVIKYHGYSEDENVLSRNEIIIIKYKDFKQEWLQIIPGKNNCKQKLGFEFIFTNKINLIYFDHKDNLVRYPDPGFYNPKKYKIVKQKSAILVRIGIDDKGNLERENIYTYVDWHFEVGSNNLVLNIGKSLAIGTYEGKKRRLDLLRVD